MAALYAKMTRVKKPIGIMTRKELKSALTRAIILEYQNAKTPGVMSWGWDKPPSMYAARVNRIRLAKLYSQKYAPVSNLLFKRKLPSGEDWPGTKELL